VSLLGWIVAAGLVLRVRELARRLELVARAEHELRGPLGALGLIGAAVARQPGSARLSAALDSQLDRARGGLADLGAARRGRRAPAQTEVVTLERAATGAAAARGPVRVDWRAGGVAVRADRRRLAQAFGNLLQNAEEHGGGDISLRARRRGERVVVEIADRGKGFEPGSRPRRRERGRGLSIAAAAVGEAGGRLRLIPGGGETTVAVDLPVEEP
jgi:signal transduction histidine kinase